PLLRVLDNNVFTDPEGTCGGKTPCFTSIQAAIDAVDSPGTVNIGAGLYTENPIVNKPVTLVGPNAGFPGNSTRNPESIVRTNGNQDAVFTISSNNVTINGLLIDGDDPGVSGNALASGDDANTNYGIHVSGTFNNIAVKYSIIKHTLVGFRGDGSSQDNL